MKIKYLLLSLLIYGANSVQSQINFSENPYEAKIIIEDVAKFWEAFDLMEATTSNPFEGYLKNGSLGVKGFIAYRIINADSLFQMVQKRKSDYEKSRNVLDGIESKKKRIIANYSAMKYWYPASKFPPIYFVVGRFNSGGTVSENGIIIGTEMLKNLDGIAGLVSHELIHFQQHIEGDDSLLQGALGEGGADFVGELISGEHINNTAFKYGNEHKDELCKEFVLIMNQDDNTDWLYGTSGRDDRPNDLGYWIGYKIIEAYFNKKEDKHKAINDILNIKDPTKFLKESGFLDNYIDEVSK